MFNLCQTLGKLYEQMGKLEIKSFKFILQNSKFNDSKKLLLMKFINI